MRTTMRRARRSSRFRIPDKVPDKKPMPFDKEQPFRNLGIRMVNESATAALSVQDVELRLREYSGDQWSAAIVAGAGTVTFPYGGKTHRGTATNSRIPERMPFGVASDPGGHGVFRLVRLAPQLAQDDKEIEASK